MTNSRRLEVIKSRNRPARTAECPAPCPAAPKALMVNEGQRSACSRVTAMDFRHRRDEMEVDESWGTHQTTALFLRVLFWKDRQSTANVRA